MTGSTGRTARLLAAAAAVALTLTACGGPSSPTTVDSSPEQVSQALAAGGEITVWSWDPTMDDLVEGFEKKYPGVTVNLVNAGTGDEQYTALQNAMAAGTGVPDVAHVEYYALSQFALTDSLTDLSGFGANEMGPLFSPGPWSTVNVSDGVYGLPMDSGPMALFYNKEVFDRTGTAVPTTWAEYLDAARRIHAADPNAYITADSGDAGFTTSMLWQTGARPYTVDGTTVGIDFDQPGTQEFARVWQALIDEKLLAPIQPWSDQWYQGLGNGTVASLSLGAWMPANLQSSVPSGKGKWRAAALPQWQAGAQVSAENGGSSLAVPAASTKKELAWAFTRYVATEEGPDVHVAADAFPATVAQLNDPAFLDRRWDYFGGQQINKVLSASAAQVGAGWQYLPYQVYANSVFNDTAGQAYATDTTLLDGLRGWRDASASYGREQGFTVN